MQFSLAVQDHKWAEAVRLGESIIAEFPNSRMAQEVTEKMDALRKRATSPELAKA
jgi:outer membrane protein assembly factor BamD (BamD/ComL family)